MNIETIAENLRNTIKGKEQLLQATFEKSQFGTYPKTLMYKGMCEVLEININELERILQDVESCLVDA